MYSYIYLLKPASIITAKSYSYSPHWCPFSSKPRSMPMRAAIDKSSLSFVSFLVHYNPVWDIEAYRSPPACRHIRNFHYCYFNLSYSSSSGNRFQSNPIQSLREAIQISLRIIRIYLHYRKEFLLLQIDSGIHHQDSPWELTKPYLVGIPSELFTLFGALYLVLVERFNPLREPPIPQPEQQPTLQEGVTLRRGWY